MAELTRGGVIARWAGTVFVSAAMALGSVPLARAAESDSQTASLPRYFTISQVVAKLHGQAANSETNGAPVKVAALNGPAAKERMAPPLAAIEGEEPFGLVTFRAPEGMLWVKWRKLEAELDTEAGVLALCRSDGARCADDAARKYLAMIDHARTLSGRVKIAWLNRTINAAVRYASDPDQYGVDDLWTAPLATLRAGLGDCEDYAIAKYVALRDAGYAAYDLRLLIVRDRIARQDHAVAAVRDGGRWVMLDNRHDVLLERKDTWHFTPMFALDLEGVKLFAVPYDKPPAGAPALVATGPSQPVAPAAVENEAAGAEALGLRVDTFERPVLRGGL